MQRLIRLFLVIFVLGTTVLSAAPTQAQSAWAPNTAYSVGALVTYNGVTYKCLQAHTSLVGWEPPNVPALWSPQGTAPTNPPPTNPPATTAPTRTRTNTPVGPTATRTNTPVGPTATRTNTTVAPTRTNTSVPATATRAPATATRTNTPSGAGCFTAYVHGNVYTGGMTVSYNGRNWRAKWWTQNEFPSTGGSGVWEDLGACGGGTVPTNTPVAATRTNTPVGPTAVPPTRTNTPIPSTPLPTATSGGTPTCAVQSAPTGKVLVGYWENWDGAANGVHPGMGWIPLSQVHARYNVINLAFPVILPDGTAKWENGMDVGVKVPSPAEMCAAKQNGRHLLLSIGGAAAAIDLSSSAVADRFIATIVPILKTYNFDGIDIDIESGLVAGASMSQLSTSQANLIRIIDGVLAQMPSNFMLTSAPETAYVTGGQIAYGGPWGAYLPILKKYLDNGRLNWLQMQYYNGSMYGCPATSFSAGTVQGFVEQTRCLNQGFSAGGGTFQIPYSKQVPGLPAQVGAGGGYMAPSLVTEAYNQVSGIKGLMTWSINWDGSKGWTFANNRPW